MITAFKREDRCLTMSSYLTSLMKMTSRKYQVASGFRQFC
eukprot:SAG22_NODE_1121_length_5508_cov_6.904234_6_plen_40_part_00